MKLDIYVNYAGKCEEAFRFYEQHVGGKITMMMTHEQQPNQANVPANRKKAILHARIEIGKTVRSDLHEDGGDLFRVSLCHAPGQVRHVLDAAPRTIFLRNVGPIT